MTYLLDTHTLIWSFTNVEKLSQAVIDEMENPVNKTCVSIVSLWEISIKYSLKKLELKGITPDQFPSLIEKAGMNIVSTSPEIISSSYQLIHKPEHKDPFDRILIWQALKENYTMMSKDRNFELYTDLGLKIIW